MRKIAAALFLMLSLSVGHTREVPLPLTGIFSDLKCVQQEGDVLGLEIVLLGGFNETSYEYFALVQFAEGVAEKPQLVPIQVDGNNITFIGNFMGQSNVKFSGAVTTKGLVGKFGKPLDRDVKLLRRNSFWQSKGNLCYS
jgi:hypothetical protein